MGKHTTPGLDTPGTRDDIVGWGAFSTVVAVILVGLFAGWFEAVGVLVLGGLTTAALWFARNHSVDVLARGRHASETPWSASDLLELKDADAQQAAARREPSRRRSDAPPRADVAAAPGAPDEAAAPPAPGTGDLETVGARAGRRSQARQQSRQQARPQSRAAQPARRTPAADPLAWLPGQQAGGPVTTDDAPTEPDGPRVDGEPGGRRSGRRAAGPPVIPGIPGGPGADDGALLAAGAVPAQVVPGDRTPEHPGVPAARTASSRRSRRTGDTPATGPGTGSRGVLPVAPFEMGVPAQPVHGGPGQPAPAVPAPPTLPGVQVPAGTRPVPTPMTGVAQVPTAGPLPVAPVPVAPPAPMPGASAATAAPVPVVPSRRTPDPLSGPLNLDAVAAEPTVLDPALDPLWLAPALDLTVEQNRVEAAPTAATAPTAPTAPPARRSAPAAEAAPLPTDRSVADRAGAAAAIDPLWARRARRPEIRRPGAPRPAAVRREPAPLEPLPRDHGASSEPYLVVLPEPDVPDVLMLPESDVVQPDGPGHDVSWNGTPDVPVSRPAPGTLSLDELLVLHTRRPAGRRTVSDDQAAEITERRLE
ncbi:hypothetical protein [Kineosporia sp. A_224]|uniref:hypothetical protein n=1 Tax=Kineosporia sp. A_224 TaxID=1962180 RepID=UPI000B4C0141|nr:hypothetical protein [Kineosporia sp. A_224]